MSIVHLLKFLGRIPIEILSPLKWMVSMTNQNCLGFGGVEFETFLSKEKQRRRGK